MPKEHNYQKQIAKHERTQKLRKAKKNMRPNAASRAPRQRDWEHFAEDEWDSPGFYEDERVMPRGSESRHKVVEAMARQSIKKAGEEIENDPDALPEGTVEGVVIEAAGEQCVVQVDGRQVDCVVRRSLLVKETTFTSVVAAGDNVAVRLGENGSSAVEQVMPRRSVLARPEGNTSYRQLVAANVDLVLVVASWQKPAIWPELIDRYLIAAERSHLEAVVCVNKVDLVDNPDELEDTLQPYRDAGYQVLVTSAETGAGIENLRALLTDAVTVFAGLSGVGKSSLLSAIQPGLSLRALSIGERGKNRNQGRHTTTMASLYPLKDGGAVIDTPGIREFGLAFLGRHELASFYPEIVARIGACAFADCSHTHEPDCAVKLAVETGELSELRYENYVKILESLAE